uniref:Capsid protein n=1 Tax=Syrmaticus ellioti CRESS-DNA-virus sp. TaxID=2815058 RepID=A0A8A4XBV8_9VIRU|nr:MAG: capsid protein [Syrmaticus ellioti CRESS-DNA-virus sp.]
MSQVALYPNQSMSRPHFRRDIAVIRGGASLLRSANRAYKAYKKTRTQSATQSAAAASEPITGHFDYKTDYRKRRLTRRGRRRQKRTRKWKRRVVNAVRDSTLGTNHFVRRSLGLIQSAQGLSASVSVSLYGMNGTNTDGLNATADVGELFQEMDQTSWDNANNLLPSQGHRISFQHATLEVTLRNTGTTDAVIEAYYVRGRKPLTPAWGDLVNTYNVGFQKQGRSIDPHTTNQIGESELSSSTIGVTPFQNSLFCRSFNIYKRQKFVLPPGKDINVTISDSRRRFFNIVEANRFATDRKFHGILFQQQGSPALESGSGVPVTALATDVVYMAVRRYRYKPYLLGDTRDAFDTAA